MYSVFLFSTALLRRGFLVITCGAFVSCSGPGGSKDVLRDIVVPMEREVGGAFFGGAKGDRDALEKVLKRIFDLKIVDLGPRNDHLAANYAKNRWVAANAEKTLTEVLKARTLERKDSQLRVSDVSSELVIRDVLESRPLFQCSGFGLAWKPIAGAGDEEGFQLLLRGTSAENRPFDALYRIVTEGKVVAVSAAGPNRLCILEQRPELPAVVRIVRLELPGGMLAPQWIRARHSALSPVESAFFQHALPMDEGPEWEIPGVPVPAGAQGATPTRAQAGLQAITDYLAELSELVAPVDLTSDFGAEHVWVLVDCAGRRMLLNLAAPLRRSRADQIDKVVVLLDPVNREGPQDLLKACRTLQSLPSSSGRRDQVFGISGDDSTAWLFDEDRFLEEYGVRYPDAAESFLRATRVRMLMPHSVVELSDPELGLLSTQSWLDLGQEWSCESVTGE